MMADDADAHAITFVALRMCHALFVNVMNVRFSEGWPYSILCDARCEAAWTYR